MLIFFSLISSDPTDPTFVSTDFQQTNNWVGFVGANIAAFLFGAIGLISYTSPALLMFLAYKCFKSKSLYIPVGRLAGLILFICSGAGLSTLFLSDTSIAGEFFANFFLAPLIGIIGAGILLTAVFMVSLLLVTNLSLASFFDSVKMAWENFQVHFGERFTKFRKWQEKGREEAKVRAEKRNKIRTTKQTKTAPKISTGKSSTAREEIDPGGVHESISGKVTAAIKRLGEDPESEGSQLKTPGVKPEIENIREKQNRLPLGEPGDPESKDLVTAGTEIPIAASKENGELNGDGEATVPGLTDTPLPAADYKNYVMPPIHYLSEPEAQIEYERAELEAIAQQIKDGAGEFNVKGEVPKNKPWTGCDNL